MNDLPLRDIHLPTPLMREELFILPFYVFIIIFTLIALLIFLIKKQQKPVLKRLALKNLEAIQNKYEETKNAGSCLAELSIFFRRTVLSQKECCHMAAVTGKEWLLLLDRPLNSREFSEGVGQLLLDGPYKKDVDREDVEELLTLTFKWVNNL